MRKVIMLTIILIGISAVCFGAFIDDDGITLEFFGSSWPIDRIFVQEPDNTEAFLKCWPLKVLPDLQREKFFGAVSQIVESIYSYKQSFGSYSYSEDTLEEMNIFTYDTKGNRIGDMNFYINSSGEVRSRFLVFSYDTEGKMEDMVEFESSDNPYMSKALFLNHRRKMLNNFITLDRQYETLLVDDKGKPLERPSEKNTSFRYDNTGKVITKYVLNGIYYGTKTDYLYSNFENKVRANVYNPDRKTIKAVRIYTADSNNNIIEISEYNGDGSLRNTRLADYDDKGNISSIKIYDSKGDLQNVNYSKYFPEDNSIKVYWDYSNPDYFQSITKYNQYYLNEIGLIDIEEKSYPYSDTSYFRHEYEYDTKGNWVKKIIRKKEAMFDGTYWVPYEVITRTILYHSI